MRTASGEANEWIDGFLFVGNKPILDFLNTKLILADGLTELLPDTHSLEKWLAASGMVTSSKTKSLLRSWRNSPEASAFLDDLVAFRERLRGAVERIETHSLPADSFLNEINSRLLQHPPHTSVHKRDGKILRETFFQPHEPSDFWTPFIDATADLLSETEQSRLRKCESCIVHFFDKSKKGARRWCSMNMCGNKIKVAAYQQRKRNSAIPEG